MNPMNNTNVTAFTDTELADLLTNMNRGGIPFFAYEAVGEIRRGCDRMAGYKTHYTDAEFYAIIGRHLDFYGFEA
jgi:hypothetical protein